MKNAILLGFFTVLMAASAHAQDAPAAKPKKQTIPPAAAADATFVGAGDIAGCSDLSGAEATAKLLDKIPGIVFAAGDLAYGSGTDQEFNDCYGKTWGRHKARTKPAPGNHEYNSKGAAGYYHYFGAAAGDPQQGWYSFELGAWHVVSLNSNCAYIGGCEVGSAQEKWLRKDLALHPGVCTMAFMHHPLVSSGPRRSHAIHPELKSLWQALYDAHAALVVVGHEHNYERFALLNSDGDADPARGIREFVVGSGGRNHTPLIAIRNSEVRNTDTFGVLKLTLHAKSYNWEFIPEAGKSFTDSGSEACH